MGWVEHIPKLVLIIFLVIILSVAVVSITDAQIPASFFGGEELFSPSDWVKERQIKVYNNRVVLDIEDAIWAKFTDTNSMDPFIDENANAIEIKPASADSINVGDIVSYQSEYGVIIHRVIEKGEDENGTYFVMKGDNNRFKDPDKVRFEDVVGVLVAIIY